MEEFIYLNTINYNNNKFKVFTNRKYPIYILELLEDGKLCYPQYEDYIGYFEQIVKFNTNIICNFQKFSFSEINKKRKEKKFRFNPKVISKSKLISIAMALALSGYAKISSIDTTISEEKPILEIINQTNKAKKLGYDVYFSDFDHENPFIHEYNEEVFGGDTIFCKDLEEFKKLVNQEITPTYQDVEEVFRNNETIPQEYKTILLKGLNNMEKDMPDFDLSVLYKNAQRMNFVKRTADEIAELSGGFPSTACFNKLTGVVSYNPDSPNFDEFVIAHECLGHGGTEIVCKENGKLVYYGFSTPVLMMSEEENHTQLYPYHMGNAFAEAAADTIAGIASKQPQQTGYSFVAEELRIITELCNKDFSEILNKRGVGLYEEMYANNVDNPYSYAIYADQLLNNCMSGNIVEKLEKEAMGISDIIENLVVDFCEEDVIKNGFDVIENAVTIVTNNNYYKEERKMYTLVDGKKVLLDQYDAIKTSQNIKQTLEELKIETKTKEDDDVRE